ncbi:MAG: TenA family transcriptional regulator [Candidatus Binatia bacterium]
MYRLDRRLSPEEFRETFLKVKAGDLKKKDHPWDALFREGKCTKPQLQGWAKDLYYWKTQVPIKDYGILRNCPYPDVRRMWLSHAIEEDGEDIIGGEHGPHPEYWLKFCEGVGLSREYVINAEPLPAVKFAVDAWTHGAAKSWLVGVAMSETGDMAKGIAQTLEILRQHYSWIPESALEFWRLHSEVDVGHSQMSLDILARYCTTRELQEECTNAMLTYNNILRVMRDAVYLAYVVEGVVLGQEAQAA